MRKKEENEKKEEGRKKKGERRRGRKKKIRRKKERRSEKTCILFMSRRGSRTCSFCCCHLITGCCLSKIVAGGHTGLNTPDLFRTLKLSSPKPETFWGFRGSAVWRLLCVGIAIVTPEAKTTENREAQLQEEQSMKITGNGN